MRRRLPLLLTLGLAAGATSQTPDADAAAWAGHRTTRVLYAGWPGGSREQAFESFLKQWFDRVHVIDLQKLDAQSARDFDVVIADWGSQYGNDGYPPRESGLRQPNVQLADDFDKPIVAMAYVSSILRSRHKLDWL